MHTTSVTQFRNALPKYLHYVQQGEHILLTAHGKPIARILPLLDAQKDAQAQLSKLRQICKIEDVVSPVRTQWDADK